MLVITSFRPFPLKVLPQLLSCALPDTHYKVTCKEIWNYIVSEKMEMAN